MTDVSPAPEDRLDIRTEAGSDPVTFVLEGELDPHTSPMLQSMIDEATGEGDTVALDFAGVSFVDSAGLRVIADTHRRLHESGGGLVVRRPSDGLRRLLALTGLADHVDIQE
jgi:anti-sigma B factor antagonist